MSTGYTIQQHQGKSIRKFPTRIIIIPKDVEIITGCSYRTACRMLRNIRKTMGKTRTQMISIEDFCLHTGIQEHLVKTVLMN